MIILREKPLKMCGLRFIEFMKKAGKSIKDIISYKRERHVAAVFFWGRWKKANNRLAKNQIQKEVAEKKREINKKYI